MVTILGKGSKKMRHCIKFFEALVPQKHRVTDSAAAVPLEPEALHQSVVRQCLFFPLLVTTSPLHLGQILMRCNQVGVWNVCNLEM